MNMNKYFTNELVSNVIFSNYGIIYIFSKTVKFFSLKNTCFNTNDNFIDLVCMSTLLFM